MSNFLAQNWGSVASVVGLVISIWVLIVARKAKAAAEKARFLARLKTVVEELKEANNKVSLVGVFLREQKWEIAQLVANEVLGICVAASSRWGDQMEQSRNDLLNACTLMRSISDLCDIAATRALIDDERLAMIAAQSEAFSLISGALGHAQKLEERSPSD